MTCMRTCLLALCCLGVLGGQSTACCYARVDPKVLIRYSPVVVTGTIVRIDPADPERGRHFDVAHVRIEVVHKNALTDVSVEPGGELQINMAPKEWEECAGALRYPLGSRAIWIATLDKEARLRVDLHPGQRHPVEKLEALGPLAEESPRYTKAEWRARLEATERWEERGRRVARISIGVATALHLWDKPANRPSGIGTALFSVALIAFGTLLSLCCKIIQSNAILGVPRRTFELPS